MASVITVSGYQFGTTPPSKQHNVGVSSILDVLPFTQASIPFINSVLLLRNDALPAVYCNEAASTIKTAANS